MLDVGAADKIGMGNLAAFRNDVGEALGMTNDTDIEVLERLRQVLEHEPPGAEEYHRNIRVRHWVQEVVGADRTCSDEALIEIIKRDRRHLGRLRIAAAATCGLGDSTGTDQLIVAMYGQGLADGRPSDAHEQEMQDAQHEIDTLRIRLDNALHASYRLASVACDISGADMQAVRRAADQCGCDHEDSPEPHNPRREWREG